MLTNALMTSSTGTPPEQSPILMILKDYPDLANEVLEALSKPSVPFDFNPTRLETYFDDVLVSVRGAECNYSLSFSSSYRPNVIAVYGDNELLLVKANDQIILNRLSSAYVRPEWSIYGNK